MYSQIESDFKKQSKIRTSQLLYIVGVFLFVVIFAVLLNLFANSDNYWVVCTVIVVIGVLGFFIVCYIIAFFKGLPKSQRNIKNFFNVSSTIDAYQNKLHDADIRILKKILEEHKINTRPKIEEAIRHYQCLLPKKILPTGQLLSILAFVISTLALLVSETVISSAENMGFILAVIAAVIIGYIVTSFIEKNYFHVFGKDALYTRIEDSLSEIFMTYYLRKEDKLGEKNNG